MIITTPQDWADAINTVVNNYMYWQLINNGLGILAVFSIFALIGWLVYKLIFIRHD